MFNLLMKWILGSNLLHLGNVCKQMKMCVWNKMAIVSRLTQSHCFHSQELLWLLLNSLAGWNVLFELATHLWLYQSSQYWTLKQKQTRCALYYIYKSTSERILFRAPQKIYKGHVDPPICYLFKKLKLVFGSIEFQR